MVLSDYIIRQGSAKSCETGCSILSTYHRTGQCLAPTVEAKGKPPYRIQAPLEKVIRQRIRARNRQGSHVSVRTLLHWLSEHYEGMNPATLWRALQRMGFVYGTSRSKSALGRVPLHCG